MTTLPTVPASPEQPRYDNQSTKIAVRKHPSPRYIRCPAGRGWAWWGESWRLFRRYPGSWLLLDLVLIGLFFVTSIVPLGTLALPVIMPCVTIGVATAMATARRGREPLLEQLCEGFKGDIGPLLGLGAFNLIASLVLGTPLAIIGILAIATLDLRHLVWAESIWDVVVYPTELMVLAVLFLLVLTALAAAYMAVWLAPLLVRFRQAPVGAALRNGFMAVMANWQPCTLYALAPLVVTLLLGISGCGLFFLFVAAFAPAGNTLPEIILAVMIALVPGLIGLGSLLLAPIFMQISAVIAYSEIYPDSPAPGNNLYGD